MNVLIIGSGGREHALALAFARSPKTQRIVVSPGNAGIAKSFETIDLPTFDDIYLFCTANNIGLVFIGPEIPIEAGLSDYLSAKSIPVIAPSSLAARLETSKMFAKNLMQKHSIPTARFCTVNTHQEALRALDNFSFPLVLKADGLAAGKGVVIAKDKEQAEDFVHNTMENGIFGNAGTGLVIEEFLQGWEVSLFAFTDGVNFKTTLFSQDHKQAYDHDQGPNTGGMGAYAPVPEAEYYRQEIESKIIDPVLAALREEGCPYEGILYAGLMITKDGAKVIEFNCRFGDPETQVVLPLLETDFLDVCQAINNHKIDKLELKWKDSSCVCVVLASQGYPGTYEKGNEISIPVDIETRIIYAGVGNNQDKLLSTGGRVLGVLGLGPELEEAIHDAYQNVSKVFFRGMTFRKDIGRRTNKLYKVD